MSKKLHRNGSFIFIIAGYTDIMGVKTALWICGLRTQNYTDLEQKTSIKKAFKGYDRLKNFNQTQ